MSTVNAPMEHSSWVLIRNCSDKSYFLNFASWQHLMKAKEVQQIELAWIPHGIESQSMIELYETDDLHYENCVKHGISSLVLYNSMHRAKTNDTARYSAILEQKKPTVCTIKTAEIISAGSKKIQVELILENNISESQLTISE